MGTPFSDGTSELGLSSMSSTLRPPSSQSSLPSMERPSDSLGTDSLQESLSSSWASYLSAQHGSRELSALKRSVTEQIDSVKASTRSLQQEALRHQNLVATTLSEFREQSERAASDLNRLKPLQDSLPALRQELQSHGEKSSKSFGELSDNFSALQERVDGLESLVSKDTKTAQDRYGAALKMIEFLQGELKGLTAEKIALENKLSVVERKVETMAETNRPLPEATVEFLAGIFSRRDDLLKLLDNSFDLVVHLPPVPSGEDVL
jgi:chromosome segregation ATPase